MKFSWQLFVAIFVGSLVLAVVKAAIGPLGFLPAVILAWVSGWLMLKILPNASDDRGDSKSKVPQTVPQAVSQNLANHFRGLFAGEDNRIGWGTPRGAGIAVAEIEAIVDILVMHQVDPELFLLNGRALAESYREGVGGLGGVMPGDLNIPPPTPSIKNFTSRVNALIDVPIWIVSAFPDVCQWTQIVHIETTNDPNNRTLRCFGLRSMEEMEEVEKKLSSVVGMHAHHPAVVCRKVAAYTRETGRRLETASHSAMPPLPTEE